MGVHFFKHTFVFRKQSPMLNEQNDLLNGTHSTYNIENEFDDVMCVDEEEEAEGLEGTSTQHQTFRNDQQRRLSFIQTTALIKDELHKAEQGQVSGKTIETLFEKVHHSNVEIDNVRLVNNLRTLRRGSETLDQLIQLSVTQVEGMKDETAHSLDPGKLVARLKSFAISNRKNGDFDHFSTIGRHFSFLLQKPPNFSYLRPCYELKLDGPHLREKTQRKQPTQKPKEHVQVVEGKTVSQMDDSMAVNKELDNVRRHLKRVYKQNGTDTVDYYRFVLNPDSFGETVENMFFVSFLIRDGQIRLRVDPRSGLASIVKLSREEREERCYGQERPTTQTVPRLDYVTWRAMVRELNITKPYITRQAQ